MIYLTSKIAWFGAKTGYERLPEFVGGSSTIWSRSGVLPRIIGKVASIASGHGHTRQNESCARVELALKMLKNPSTRSHILWGEDNLSYWGKFPKRLQEKTIYTFHQPPSQWQEKTGALNSVKAGIVLYQKDLDFFRRHAPSGRFEFVHYGTDTEFFVPGTPQPQLRLLYNGVHLRNVEMFARILDVLNARYPDLRIDALVPIHRRTGPVFQKLLINPAITWHAGLDDEALRSLYQAAYLQLLPLNDSGANTALVEALSCGVPSITTDVGGVRDYGGNAIYPIVGNNDDEAMISLISQYLESPEWREKVSRDCREFAVKELAWPVVAEKHLAVYRSI